MDLFSPVFYLSQLCARVGLCPSILSPRGHQHLNQVVWIYLAKRDYYLEFALKDSTGIHHT